MTRRRKRILFLAEGVTMAHFTRPALLAESLDPDEFEVIFRTPARYHRLLRPVVANIGDLRTIDPAVFLETLANGGVLYREDTLRQYVADEIALLREHSPDLVIGDYRMSLSVSAEKCGVPFASIFNAYWSKYGTQPAVVPEIPLTRIVPARFLNPLYKLARPLFYAVHARPLNTVRKEYGLTPLPGDIREFYTTGNLVLYPDVPEMVPLHGAPAHHHFVGPCLWTSNAPEPTWWTTAMASPRRKVFVALGSSGPLKALPNILRALAGFDVDVLLATSGRSVAGVPEGVYVAELLPFESTAAKCALIVSHGGSSGIYPALSAGVPVLALPANIDTHLSAGVLVASGAGISRRIEEASPKRLSADIDSLLTEPGFTIAAVQAQLHLRAHDSTRIFPALLREWFSRN